MFSHFPVTLTLLGLGLLEGSQDQKSNNVFAARASLVQHN